jgi:hypothetical protein
MDVKKIMIAVDFVMQILLWSSLAFTCKKILQQPATDGTKLSSTLPSCQITYIQSLNPDISSMPKDLSQSL